MNNEILDDEFQITTEKNYPKIINWISIIMLWVGIGYCGFYGLLGEIRVIIAIVLLVVSTVLTYFNYELGINITLGIILIGILNLVDFSPIKYFFGFGIFGVKIMFDLLLCSVGIIHYLTNRTAFSKFLNNLSNKETEAETKSINRSEVNGFKRRFSNRKIGELELIVNNELLLPEAIKAAKELIEEKKKMIVK